MNGANFGEGLGSGLTAGVIVGVTGGLANGISSGFKANRAGLDFFNGKEMAIVQPYNTINSGAVVSSSSPIPRVYAKGDYLDWTGTIAGPDGGFVFRTGTAKVEYTSGKRDLNLLGHHPSGQRFRDWDYITECWGWYGRGRVWFNVDRCWCRIWGSNFFYWKRSLIFGFYIRISSKYQLVERWNYNWASGVDLGTDILIKRIPGSTFSTQILLQNKSLKINMIEKLINN